MPFKTLKLSPEMNQALTACGFTAPFPVQAEAIPLILTGKDLCIQAQTGSGKTITFLAPLLDKLTRSPRKPGNIVRALTLVPTRELAIQIGEVAKKIGNLLPTRLAIKTAVGGMPIQSQAKALSCGVDFLVATPGRLLDLLRREAFSLSTIEYLILDEADKMLELGFSAEIGQIRALLPQKRQSLLFSATMQSSTESLVQSFLHDYSKIVIAPHQIVAPLIEEKSYLVDLDDKGPFLRDLITKGGWDQILVFVCSGRRADNVTRKLNTNGINAMALHGDKSQGARTEAFAKFKAKKIRVLVATDIASRGLDIDSLPCVINYELPRSVKDYVHRVGRTGRAGQTGLALTLVSPSEESHLKLTEKFLQRKIARVLTNDE